MLHNQSIQNQQLVDSPELLENLLRGLTDATQVQQATQILTSFIQDISSCGPLLSQLQNSQDATVRKMAAVYIRSKISSYAQSFTDENVTQIKSVLVQCLQTETQLTVLRSIGALVIQVAKLFDWHEDLLSALFELMQNGNTTQQEIAITAMRNMVPVTGGAPHESYIQVFTQGLNGTKTMQFESLKGLSGVATQYALDQAILSSMNDCFIQMANICQNFITDEDESISRYAIEMWHDLLTEGALVGSETEIFNFMLKVGAESGLHVNVRYQVVEYVKHYCKQFPNRMLTEGLLEPTMKFCIFLLMESYQLDEDAISSPLNMAIEIMDGMFLNLRVDKTTPMALEGVQKLIEGGHVRSALALLAIMTEGCAEVLRQKSLLTDLVQLLMKGVEDPAQETRKVAYEALTQFVYHISPEMNEYAPQLMPALFNAISMEANIPTNLESVCITLDSYSSCLGEDIKPYVGQILQTLMALLDPGSMEVKEACISALSSTLMTAREIKQDIQEISQLAEIVMGILQNANEENLLKLRAEATNLLGEIFQTIGADATAQTLESTNILNLVLEGCSTDCTELKEYSFGFFGVLALLFKENLLQIPQFEMMFHMVCECLDDEDGLVQQKDDDGFGNTEAPGMGDEGVEDDHFISYKFYCATGFLEEKTSAAAAVEKFASSCGPGFQKYWETAFQRIVDCMSYPHPALKGSVMRAFHYCMLNVIETIKKNNIQSQEALQCGQDYLRMTVTLYLVSIMRENDRECCVETLISLSELLKQCGQELLGLNGGLPNENPESCWEEFIEIIVSLLEEVTECQAPEDIQLQEKKREVEDNPILDGITDICTSLCSILTLPQLVMYWETVFPKLAIYLDPKRSHIEFSLAIGCIGDVSSHLSEEAIQPFLEPSLQMVFQGLQHSQHHLVQQNAVYALGCLCRAGKNHLQPALQQILEVLLQGCQISRGLGDDQKQQTLLRDNAYSSLGSVLANIDLDQDTFNQAFQLFINGVPLEKDFAENQWVAKALLLIAQNRSELVRNYEQQIQTLLQQSLQWKEMPQELVQQITGLFSTAI